MLLKVQPGKIGWLNDHGQNGKEVLKESEGAVTEHLLTSSSKDRA